MNDVTRVLIPVRYSAWLSGDLGRRFERDLRHGLAGLSSLRVARIAGGFLVEAEEDPGPVAAAVAFAMGVVEDGVRCSYPMMTHDLGPLFAGTFQVVLGGGCEA